MKPKKKWDEVVISDYTFDGYSLYQLKNEIDEMIAEYDGLAVFNYEYHGYDNAYEVRLLVEVEEDDSTYSERIVQEELAEQRALDKKEKKALEKVEKLAKERVSKEKSEREMLKQLKEKYGE